MISFRIPDMTCGRCASTIARAVAEVDNVAHIAIDVPGKRVSITSAAGEAELREAIRDAGYTPERIEPATAGPAVASDAPSRCCGGARQARAASAGVQPRGACCG